MVRGIGVLMSAIALTSVEKPLKSEWLYCKGSSENNVEILKRYTGIDQNRLSYVIETYRGGNLVQTQTYENDCLKSVKEIKGKTIEIATIHDGDRGHATIVTYNRETDEEIERVYMRNYLKLD